MFAFDLAAGTPSGTSDGNNFIDPPAFGVWDTLGPTGVSTASLLDPEHQNPRSAERRRLSRGALSRRAKAGGGPLVRA